MMGTIMLNPYVGFTALYFQLHNQAKDEYKESMARQGKPYDEDEAFRYSVLQGLGQVPFEGLGTWMGGRVIKMTLGNVLTAAGRGLKGEVATQAFKLQSREFLKAMAAETFFTNNFQHVVQNVNANNYGVQERKSWSQIFSEMPEVMKLSAAQTMLMTGLPLVVSGGRTIPAAIDKARVEKLVDAWNRGTPHAPLTVEQYYRANEYLSADIGTKRVQQFTESIRECIGIQEQIRACQERIDNKDANAQQHMNELVGKLDTAQKRFNKFLDEGVDGVMEACRWAISLDRISDPVKRSLVDASLRALSGRKVTPAVENVLAQNGAYEIKNSWIVPDTMISAVSEIAPWAGQLFLGKSESAQLESAQGATKVAPQAASQAAPQASQATPQAVQPTTPTSGLSSGKPAGIVSNKAPVMEKYDRAGFTRPRSVKSMEASATGVRNPADARGNYQYEVSYTPRNSSRRETTTRFSESETIEGAQREAEAYRALLERGGATVHTIGQISEVTPTSDAASLASRKAGVAEPGVEVFRGRVITDTAAWQGIREFFKHGISIFGYKVADTGIDVGLRGSHGKVNLGTQIWDKVLEPGSEIGRFMDNVANSQYADVMKPLADAHPGWMHRVFFGHDFASNVGQVVEKFGWGGLPDYVWQLFKDSSTKSGIPLPFTEMLVRKGVMSGKTAYALSTNIGGFVGAGVSFLGTYRLYRDAKAGHLTKPRVVFATVGMGVKLVGGAATCQPLIFLSGLCDAVILVTKVSDIKAAFSHGLARQAKQRDKTAGMYNEDGSSVAKDTPTSDETGVSSDSMDSSNPRESTTINSDSSAGAMASKNYQYVSTSVAQQSRQMADYAANPQAAKVKYGMGIKTFLANHVWGKYAKLDYYAPGLAAALKARERNDAMVQAGLNDMMRRITDDAKAAFGYVFKADKETKARYKKFCNELLPVAACLEAVSINEDGTLVFKDFWKRSGIIPATEGTYELGQKIKKDGRELKIGEYVAEYNGYVVKEFMDVAAQEKLYWQFWEKYPEGAHLLDRWIAPGKTMGYTTEAGTMLCEFNRTALHDYYNIWPAELKEIFGDMPIDNVGYVEGYTPDVAQTNTFKQLIRAKVLSLLHEYRSPARKIKTGWLNQSGKAKSLFEGFQTRANQAHLEKSNMRWRQQAIETAAIPGTQISEANMRHYVRLDEVFEKVTSSVLLAQNMFALDKVDFPSNQKARLIKLFGDAYRLQGRGLWLPKHLERELRLGIIRSSSNRLLARIGDTLLNGKGWDVADLFIQRHVAAMIGAPQTIGNNLISNIISFSPFHGYQRLCYALAATVTGDGKAAKLSFRELSYLVQGLKGLAPTERGAEVRKMMRDFVPIELFAKNTAQSMAFEMNTGERWFESILTKIKELNPNGAFLTAVRYDLHDGLFKKVVAYAAYMSHASLAADQAGITEKTARETFMRDFIKNAPDQLHQDAMATAQFWFLDYSDVSHLVDAGNSSTKASMVMKRATAPFMKFSFNAARQLYRVSFGSALNLFSPSKLVTKNQRLNAAANLMTLGSLAGSLGFLWGLGRKGDENEMFLGTNVDEDGKTLPSALQTGNRLNLSAIVRVLQAHLKIYLGNGTVTDGIGNEQDLWMRYRQYPYYKEALLMALLGRTAFGSGEGKETWKLATGIMDEYVTYGILKNFLALPPMLTGTDKNKSYSYRAGEGAYDLLSSPFNLPRWQKFFRDMIDPVSRSAKPVPSVGYDATFFDGIRGQFPVASLSMPAAGSYKPSSLSLSSASGMSGDQQRDVFSRVGLPAPSSTAVESRVTLAKRIQELEKLGVGKESIGTREVNLPKGGTATRAYVPDPRTVYVAPRSKTLSTFSTGLNIKPVARGKALTKEEMLGK